MQSEVVRYAGHPTTTSVFYNTIFWLCGLCMVNSFVRRAAPHWALQRHELLALYVALNIGSAISGHDTVQVLLPIIAHPFYRADNVNRWAENLLPDLPRHLVVTDLEALKPFFSGSSSLYRDMHWKAWLLPATSWCLFLFVLLSLLLCINILLRRRWTQSERLAFPLVMLPIELTTPGAPILKNKILWVGFAIAVLLQLWNGAATLQPSIPMIPLKYVDYGKLITERPWSSIGFLPVAFYPFGIALGMLLPIDMLFSSWFFFWLWKAQFLVTAYMGWDQQPNFPYVNAQSLGAYIGIACGALWAARKHFAWVLSIMLGDEKEVQDPDEPIPLRLAAWLAVICLIILVVFCRLAGLNYWVIGVVLAIYLAISVAVSRMRGELGPPVHDLHYAGPDSILPQILGPAQFEKSDLTGLSFLWGFNRAYRGHVSPIQLEAFKMTEQTGGSPRAMFCMMVFAGLLAPIAAFWALLHLGYERGAAANIAPPNVLAIFGNEAWSRWSGWIQVPQAPQSGQGVAVLIGMTLTFLLNLVRGRVIGFPFHPVGYAVSSSWGMGILWVPMLIAWILKLVILRYGGLTLYRKVVPLLHGVILGECIMGSLWTIIGITQGIPTYAFWP